MSYLFIRSSSDFVLCVCFTLFEDWQTNELLGVNALCNSFVCHDLANH